MLAQVEQGDPFGIAWAAFAILGVANLLIGIGSALTHEDDFRLGSFVWSVGVMALGAYALTHKWVLTDSADSYHYSYAFWLGWMASNAVNLWLQLRGWVGQRQPVMPLEQPQQTRLHRRRRIRTEWLEEFEAHDIDAGQLQIDQLHHAEYSPLHLPFPAAPGVIEHAGDASQLVYVKQGNTFVPLGLPDATLPVDRRLR
jgi:hypothetical protein